MAYDIILGRDAADKKKFGKKGLAYLGKGYVKMGNYTSLSNNLWMDVARTHVVLVAGKRGSGKCLHGDTLITLANGNQIPIKDLESNKDKIISLNNKLKIEESEKSDFFSRKTQRLLKINLRSGKEIKLTPEHPLLTIKGWEEAQKLLIGSRIATPRKIEVKNSGHFPESELKLLAESDIFWDEIVKIELLEGEFVVYDICVPGNHNFVANDIIVHNSYTIGVIAEELAHLDTETARNVASLIFDTMGIFWTMKFKNEKEKDLLASWNIESKSLPVRVFVPYGKAAEYTSKMIPYDEVFALDPSELEADDWITTFNLTMTSQEGALISQVIANLKKQPEYSFSDMLRAIQHESAASQETRTIVLSLFKAAQSWGVFAQARGTNILDLVKAGQTTILDTSVYSSIGSFNVRALVIGLVSKKLFSARMAARKKEEIESVQHGNEYLQYSIKRDMPLVWIFVDEAHEFLPRTATTPATDALVQILREGRQPGISLVLATQQPGQIHKDVMTQSDIVIAHKVTSQPDIEALNQIMQTYLLETIRKNMEDLPAQKGAAIVLDDNSERIYAMRMRPRFTWHGGEAPVAIKPDKSSLE